jgi:STAS-like domain of unknown function (DUF4325)
MSKMIDEKSIVDIGKEFTRFPAGRTTSDGPYCGEAFREKFLCPFLERGQPVTIRLDSALGYGSSFLEETFGGLVRRGFEKDIIRRLINLETNDPLLKKEIESYIEEAIPPG